MVLNSVLNQYRNRSKDNLQIVKNLNVRAQLKVTKGSEERLKYLAKRGFERLHKLLIRNRVSVNERECIYAW